MNEALQKINAMIKGFNETFDISVNVNVENDEEIVDGLKIDNLKNDGSVFVNELFDIFGTIISSSSPEHELIYNKERGLVIAKKVVNVDYVFED